MPKLPYLSDNDSSNGDFAEITDNDPIWNEEKESTSYLRTLIRQYSLIRDKIKGTIYIISRSSSDEALIDIGMYESRTKRLFIWNLKRFNFSKAF